MKYLLWTWVLGFLFQLGSGGDQPAFAGTYYVAPNGDDGADGSISSPWKTIGFAVESTGPGDTILVRGGTYQERVIIFRGARGMRQHPMRGGMRMKRGSRRLPPTAGRYRERRMPSAAAAPGAYWVLKAYPGEEVILESDGPLRIRVPYVRVEGIHFVGSGVGTVGSSARGGAHHVQFVRNRFTGSGFRYSAISVSGDNNLVEGNIVLIDEQDGTLDHGIYVHSGKDNIIRNNYVSGMQGYGIHIFYQSGRRNTGPTSLSGTVVENNVITNSRQRSGIIVATAHGRMGLEKLTIRNNLIFGNRGNGIDLRPNIKDIEIYNNTIYGNEMGGITMGLMAKQGGTIENVVIRNNIVVIDGNDSYHILSNSEVVKSSEVDHNLFWPGPIRNDGGWDKAGNLVASPDFVNAAAFDFRLREKSAARDAGADLGVPFSGKAPDLGALETGEQKSLSIPIYDFHASGIGNLVKLTWSTFPQTGEVGFEIERSSGESGRFQKVGFVAGTKPTAIVQNYEFLDENLAAGIYQYRIKKVDRKGNFHHSPIIEVRLKGVAEKTAENVSQGQ